MFPTEYQYNIPVCIWLHETHPVSRPRCSVRPAVSMVINPVCPFVDAEGIIKLPCLSNWTQGVSNLTRLVTEMRTAFHQVTPLYARTPPTSGGQADPPLLPGLQAQLGPQASGASRVNAEQGGAQGQRSSYMEELLEIDFGPPHTSNPFTAPLPSASSHPSHHSPSSHPSPSSRPTHPSPSPSQPMSPADVKLLLSRLQLNSRSGPSTTGSSHQPAGSSRPTGGGEPLTTGSVHQLRGSSGGQPMVQRSQQPGLGQPYDQLPPEKAQVFWNLMTMQSRQFQPLEALEAVQLCKDLASALKYLSHTCPICQEQVTFSKFVPMTHCPCSLCESCFKACFTAAIKEKTVDKLVCPLCSRPDIRGKQGMEDAMDYFNLLDTQIRHFLEPEIHELFQKKLRDRALQDMDHFRWCFHCSFGMVHEADRLRMDCPNCGKSTCSQCRSPWTPEHQGVSCEDFRRWQLRHDPTHLQELDSALLRDKIECPKCHLVFYLSKGGCLHFSCSQCQHEFCGSCSQPFAPGSACMFSMECVSRGLHAHHPRNCLYHLRDWSTARLHLLLQYYKVSPPWLRADPTFPSQATPPAGVCEVMEAPDDSSTREEPCGRPALPEYPGVCGQHHKERLVEVVRRVGLDPATLYGRAELEAELRRWCMVVTPPHADQESESDYVRRLRTILAQNIPLGKDSSSSSSSSPQPSTSHNRIPTV